MNTDFFHHLHDTIILLNGDKKIAKYLNNTETIDNRAIDLLRQYNIHLIENAKDKLVFIN